MRPKRILHPSYPFENAKHWRIRAEKMRTLAEEAIDSTVWAMMLRIAADYDRLAESADDRAAHDSIMFQTAEVKLKVSLRPRQSFGLNWRSQTGSVVRHDLCRRGWPRAEGDGAGRGPRARKSQADARFLAIFYRRDIIARRYKCGGALPRLCPHRLPR